MQCVQIIPTALAAEPLGYISLQQTLQKIFELCSERVWQLHILRVKKRGRKEGREEGREEEGMRMRCLNWVVNFAVNTLLKNKITPKLLWLQTGLDSRYKSNQLRASTSASMKDRVRVDRMLRVIGTANTYQWGIMKKVQLPEAVPFHLTDLTDVIFLCHVCTDYMFSWWLIKSWKSS